MKCRIEQGKRRGDEVLLLVHVSRPEVSKSSRMRPFEVKATRRTRHVCSSRIYQECTLRVVSGRIKLAGGEARQRWVPALEAV